MAAKTTSNSEEAIASFREELQRVYLAANYQYQKDLAPLLRETDNGPVPDPSAVHELVTGKKPGLVRPKAEDLSQEPRVMRLFEGLGVRFDHELGRRLAIARRAVQMRQRQTEGEDRGLDLSGIGGLLTPLVPPEVLRPLARRDVNWALTLADEHIEQPQRSRAFAFVLEGKGSANPHSALGKQLEKLHEDLWRLLQHPSSVNEKGQRPQLAETIHAALALGVAECRVGPNRRRGYHIIEEAGMLAYAVDDDLQRCQALAHAATADALAGSMGSASGEVRRGPSDEWREAALQIAKSLSGTGLPIVIAQTAVARSLARSGLAAARNDAHELLSEPESTPSGALGDHEARRVQMLMADGWSWLNLDYAAELATGLPGGTERDRALGSVAAAAAEQGRLDVTERLHVSIENPWERARVLGLLIYHRNTSTGGGANDTAIAGDAHEEAVELAEGSPEPHLAVHALSALVTPLAVDADRHELANQTLDAAVRLARSPQLHSHERAHALSAVTIAAICLDAPDWAQQLYSEAYDAAGGLDEGGHERFHALVAAAQAGVAVAGKESEGADHGSTEFPPDDGGNGMNVDKGLQEVTSELEQVKTCCDPREVVYALAAFSRLLVQLGDTDRARKVLEDGWEMRERLSDPGALRLTAYALTERMTVLDEGEARHLATVTGSIHDPLQRSMVFAALAATCPANDPRSKDYLEMAKTTREGLAWLSRDLATVHIANALMARHGQDALQAARTEIECIGGHVEAEVWGRLASAYTRHGMDRYARVALQEALEKARPPWAAADAIVAGNQAIAVHVATRTLEGFIEKALETGEPTS